MAMIEMTIRETQRGFKAEWPIGEARHEEAEHGTVQPLAVLTVVHYGKSAVYGQPRYCYVVRLDREEQIERDEGFSIRKATIGVGADYGVRLDRRDGFKRFSRKTANELLDEWLEKAKALVADGALGERVMA